jgi:superoxide reductase
VLHIGGGQMACCNEPMEIMIEKTEDEGKEKHVPVIEKSEKGHKVKIGSVPHPMGKEHYIEWIELIADGRICRKFLKPGDASEVEFETSAENVTAREYCNVHGLWKSN